jgi:hypothetical protein
MSGTHNGPPTCIHGKPMNRDCCDACKQRRNDPMMMPELTEAEEAAEERTWD